MFCFIKEGKKEPRELVVLVKLLVRSGELRGHGLSEAEFRLGSSLPKCVLSFLPSSLSFFLKKQRVLISSGESTLGC